MRLSILTSAVLTVAVGCGAPAPETTKTGFILVTEDPGYLSVSAFFRETPTPAQCTNSTLAGCSVTDCTFSPNVQTVMLPTDRAGVITAEGQLADGGRAAVTTKGSDPREASMQRWAEGTTFTVSATGGAVPAFSGVSVKAPRRIEVTSPKCQLSCPEPLRANAPMPIVWTGEAEAPVVARLMTSASIGTDTNRLLTVECLLPKSPGSIPAEVLHHVADARGPGGFATVSVKASNRTTFVAGAYDMTLEAWDTAGVFMFSK